MTRPMAKSCAPIAKKGGREGKEGEGRERKIRGCQSGYSDFPLRNSVINDSPIDAELGNVLYCHVNFV